MSETQIPVQVTITGEQIDAAIMQSLVGTQLGQTIAKEIEKCFGTGYGTVDLNRIVKSIAERQIASAVEKVLMVDYEDKINEFVASKMTDEFVDAAFESMWTAWRNRQ